MTAAYAVTEFPSIDFRRAPGELGFVRTRDDLRGVLLHELVAGRAVWFSSDGLSFARPGFHSRLLRATAKFRRGLAGLDGNPHTAVFDWSTSRAPGIEAFAMFPIVSRVVASYGAAVICSEPRDPYVAGLLVESGFAEDPTFRWVSEEQEFSSTGLRHVHADRLASVRDKFRITKQPQFTTPQALRLVAPVVVRSSDPECADEFGETYQAAGDWAAARGASEEVAGVVTGLARELVANAVVRSHARVVSIAVGVANGFVPRLEFAVADDGIGIAAEIRRKLGIGLVDRIPERHFIAANWQMGPVTRQPVSLVADQMVVSGT